MIGVNLFDGIILKYWCYSDIDKSIFLSFKFYIPLKKIIIKIVENINMNARIKKNTCSWFSNAE